jgi:hypothetical protein
MINCFRICFNFAYNINLRRYIKAFDIDTRHGAVALSRMYSDLKGHTDPMPNVTVPGGVFARFRSFAVSALGSVGVGSLNKHTDEWTLNKKFDGKVAVFLNRLLGLPVQQQALLFGYFVVGPGGGHVIHTHAEP